MSAAVELQSAVFAALSANPALLALTGGQPRIYDHTPANVAFPYITFGRTSGYDWDTGTREVRSICSRSTSGPTPRARRNRWP